LEFAAQYLYASSDHPNWDAYRDQAKLTSEKTANDPNSRINKSLRAWKC
jgi:hypothetical protein